jgi:hypothetical protein
LRGDWGGGGAESNDREKAWPSKNHSILYLSLSLWYNLNSKKLRLEICTLINEKGESNQSLNQPKILLIHLSTKLPKETGIKQQFFRTLIVNIKTGLDPASLFKVDLEPNPIPESDTRVSEAT